MPERSGRNGENRLGGGDTAREAVGQVDHIGAFAVGVRRLRVPQERDPQVGRVRWALVKRSSKHTRSV